jgi:exodeoxyribonuclease-3
MFNKEGSNYTWWTHWANARERNVGWRIDYFLASENAKNMVKEAAIHSSVMGSDHCPVSITIEA